MSLSDPITVTNSDIRVSLICSTDPCIERIGKATKLPSVFYDKALVNGGNVTLNNNPPTQYSDGNKIPLMRRCIHTSTNNMSSSLNGSTGKPGVPIGSNAKMSNTNQTKYTQINNTWQLLRGCLASPTKNDVDGGWAWVVFVSVFFSFVVMAGKCLK